MWRMETTLASMTKDSSPVMRWQRLISGRSLIAATVRLTCKSPPGMVRRTDDTDGNAEFGEVERDMVAGDNARFFQAVDALGDRGSGQADLAADLRKGLAGIVLQGFQYLPGDLIEVERCGNGSVRHVPAILRQHVYYA